MKQYFSLLISLFFVFSVQAQCVFQMPYTEDFDGSTFVKPTTTNGTGSIDSCWLRGSTPSGAYDWTPGPPFQSSGFTGTSSDHTSGTGKFMFTHYIGFATPPINANLVSPRISLTGSVSPELTFWYHMFGSGIGTLTAQVNNGSGWVNLNTISGQQQTSNTDAWAKKVLSLSSYVGDTVRIRFVGTRTSFSTLARICIDDIKVAEAPTCAPPTALYTSGTTASSTSIGWAVAPLDSFEIQYGPIGFTLGSGTSLGASSNPQLITGLVGSTTYDIYVRRICSATDKSPWAGPVNTTTACSAPKVAPWTENFDNVKWEPYQNFNNQGSLAPCWVKTPSSGFDYLWLVFPNSLFAFQTGPNGDHTTGNGKYLGTQRISGTANLSRLRSPAIDLSTITNPEMSFWYHMYGSGIDKLEVRVKDQSGPYTTLLTLNGQQQTSSSDPWKSATIPLAQYANDTIYIMFRAYRTTNGTSVRISLDDLSVYSGPTCPKPVSLSASNVGVTQLDLSWSSGTGGSYEIKHGVPGFDPDLTGTSLSSTGSPQTVTGLAQGTSYDFYVRKFCGSTDTSFWEGPLSVKTQCLATTPYTQDFDGNDWVVPTGFTNDIGSIDDCYNRSNATTYIWTPGPEQFSSFQTGPSNDHTTGNGKFMFTNSVSFGGTAPIVGNLTTEFIDLSNLTTPELSFWYHMYGSQMGTLKLFVDNGSGWTQIFIKTGQQHTSKTANWTEEVINLSTYADDTIRLRFVGSKGVNQFNTEIAIDDIDIHELPSCPKPSNFSVSNISFNSATASWTTGGATNWQIKYGPVSGSNTISNVSTNPYVLTGLTANTQYEIWVRDSCGSADVSLWVGPLYFRTHCAPYSAPFSEDFDGANFDSWSFANQAGTVDGCFKRSDTTEFYWVPGPSPFTSFQTGPSADYSGSGDFMYTRSSGFNGNNETVFRTPWIDVSSLTSPELRYYYHMYGINIDKMQVFVQPINGTPQILFTHTGQSHFSSTAAWLQKSIPLTNVTSDTIRILFKGIRTANGFRAEMAIDEVEVSNPQNCSDPTGLSTANITVNSVEVSWTSSSSSVGSNIEYGPSGFTQGNGTFIYGVTSPYVVSGLNSSTAYDFYVQDSCYWGSTSNWSGPTAATTLACPSVTASFTYNASNLTVAFNGSGSTGTIDNYLWLFGDGNSDTVLSPNHTYAVGGTYNVILVVSNDCGNVDSVTQVITICDAINAQFFFNKSGLTASFDGSSSIGTNLSYVWLYGDGNTGTGGAVNHTYAVDGTYNVSLIVTDACGNVDTLTQPITICAPIQAVLNYTQNGLQVNFDGTSSNGAVEWYWTFGDGGSDTSSSPVYTYASTGTYLVTMYVTNLCGEQDTAEVILTLCNTPEASWSYKILSSGGNGMTVQFDGTASIGANTFMWDFGDGNTNNVSAIPVHTYGVPGLFYVVTLTVANNCGDENSFSSSLAAMVGIDELEKLGVKVFPNPVDDELQLAIPSFMQVNSVKMFDNSGKLIRQDFQNLNEYLAVNTANLPSGNYLVEVNTDAGIGIYQIVVKH